MDIYFQLMLFFLIAPQILPKNFAPGSCPIFVVFGQISVKQKSDRAFLFLPRIVAPNTLKLPKVEMESMGIVIIISS